MGKAAGKASPWLSLPARRWFSSQEQSLVLKFPEQGGTPQHVATSSSLTTHLRSLSKGDSPGGSPFQNYSSIHSQSRSGSSPNLQSRSPTISNMAALRWAPTANPKGWELWDTMDTFCSLVFPSKAQAPLVLQQHLKFLLQCPSCAVIPGHRRIILVPEPRRLLCHGLRNVCRMFECQECFGMASLKKLEGRGWEGFFMEWTI